MPRTEKRFGVVNQPSLSSVEELVPSAATTRNLLINATAEHIPHPQHQSH